jgi:hypothetical protein
MQVCTDPARHSPVPPLPDLLGAVQEKLNALKGRWSAQLGQNPSHFGEVEVEVHRAFQECADQVVAGLLAEVGQQSALEDACKKSR